MRALIGHTGFIGSSLKEQFSFDTFYNSENILDIKNKKFDLVVSAGNSSLRWMANKEPEKDLENILNFMDCLSFVSADNFVLISTIDVYKKPIGVNETTIPDADDSNPYGKHRLMLENFIKKKFAKHLIIRLPIVYGHNFRKNILYDLLNNHELDKIDTSSVLQYYNVANLMKDIELILSSNVNEFNMATTPIKTDNLIKSVFKKELNNIGKGLIYDMQTIHASLFGKQGNYIRTENEILDDLKKFKSEYIKNES